MLIFGEKNIAQDAKPQLIIVSAGFDGVQGDPVGDFQLSPGFYGHMTRVSQKLTDFDFFFHQSFSAVVYFHDLTCNISCPLYLKELLNLFDGKVPVVMGLEGGYNPEVIILSYLQYMHNVMTPKLLTCFSIYFH